MDSVHAIAKHPFKQASRETRQLAEMRWCFWWETFPLWGIHSSPGAMPLASGTAAAAHRAVPACPALALCWTVMLTAAPAVPQTSEGAGAGPGHIWTPPCVHKGHEDQVQRRAPQPASMGAEKPTTPGRVTVLLACEK